MYKFCYWFLYIVLYPFYRFKFVGVQNVPDGACLVCGNHTGLVDSLLVLLALGPKGNHAVMAKAELFKIPVLSYFLRVGHAFPVRRGASDIGAVKAGLKALKEGRRFVIFPEGTRVKKGQLSQPKPGAGMFALRTGVPIVPVYVPSGNKAFKRNVLIFGEAFTPEAVEKPGTDDYMAVTREVMNRIGVLGRKTVKAGGEK